MPQEEIAEMRAEESGAAGDDRSRHAAKSYSASGIFGSFLTNPFHTATAPSFPLCDPIVGLPSKNPFGSTGESKSS
jgi:hypothetical protein